jgi:hypothetical protein
MTLYAELDGARVLDGRIVIPVVGPITSDVTLDREVSSTSVMTLTLGTLKIVCTPWRPMRPYQGKTRVRLIGGYGGWRKVLPADGYRASANVRLTRILTDCARLCGERIEIGADRVLGSHYTREEAPAQRQLNALVPNAWRIDPDGVTRIGPRSSGVKVTTPFSVIDFDGAMGRLVIATEFHGDIVPMRILQGTTMRAPVTIGGVTHMIGQTIRTEILAA